MRHFVHFQTLLILFNWSISFNSGRQSNQFYSGWCQCIFAGWGFYKWRENCRCWSPGICGMGWIRRISLPMASGTENWICFCSDMFALVWCSQSSGCSITKIGRELHESFRKVWKLTKILQLHEFIKVPPESLKSGTKPIYAFERPSFRWEVCLPSSRHPFSHYFDSSAHCYQIKATRT